MGRLLLHKISPIEKGNAYGIKNSKFNTSAPKYSSNLYVDPKGSTNFTNPENINVNDMMLGWNDILRVIFVKFEDDFKKQIL